MSSGSASIEDTGSKGNTGDTAPQGSDSAEKTESAFQDSVAQITDGNYPVEEAYMKILGRSKYFNGIRWFSLSASGIEFNFSDASTVTVTLNGDSSVKTVKRRIE